MHDWVIRFIKGAFIGFGFVLPGVSGGALAAVFGIYERLIGFLANVTHNFKKNIQFFIPVGLGGIVGVFLLSFAVSYFLGAYEPYILWLFVGCILGTVPALWKQAEKKGRGRSHLFILGLAFVLSFMFLVYGEDVVTGGVPLHFGTWLLAGGLIGLGTILPGLSPSNFLVYMDMYKPMLDGIKSLDPLVILPLGLGLVVCVLSLSKLMNYILKRVYAGMFHCILGIVFASTMMIVPRDFNYLSWGSLVCLAMCAAGILVGLWMSRLEKKYKTDPLERG